MKQILARVLSIVAMAMVTSCASPRSRQFIREADYSAPIRVACVGDSITYGFGIEDREHNSYPAQLAVLLGDKWSVRNFGEGAATAFKVSTRPYILHQPYRDALAFNPNVVIINFGANDTIKENWSSRKEKFTSDYVDLIESFSKLKSKPRLYLCRPVPLFRDRGKAYDTDRILVEEIIPKINGIARAAHLPVIDLYAPFEGKEGMFADGVHPDANGARIMAEVIYARLVGRAPTDRRGK